MTQTRVTPEHPNAELRKKAEKWAQEEVHPASDQNRAWAVIGFEEGMRRKMGVCEAELHAAHQSGFEAGMKYAEGRFRDRHAKLKEALNFYACNNVCVNKVTGEAWELTQMMPGVVLDPRSPAEAHQPKEFGTIARQALQADDEAGKEMGK